MTSNLEKTSITYKPFYYPWAVELAKDHENIHWSEDEVDLKEDISQWKSGKINSIEKNHITQTLRLFTASDVEVGANYHNYFIPRFKNNEIRNMLASFAARECYSDDTEVLTNNGFKLFKDLDKKSDKVAQYDLSSREISFTNPLDYIEKDYSGVLHRYKGKAIDL